MTTTFYDDLAPFYHLLYPDWEASIHRQGAQLATLLANHGVMAGATILDAACGIGTQTIGLALSGYIVHASDVSPAAVDRSRQEMARRGLAAELCVADVRTLEHTHHGGFSAVLACDNAIPHLLSDADIIAALRSCREQLAPGGVLVLSVRDYATIVRKDREVRPYGVHDEHDSRFLAVQVWDWDGDQYDLRLYLTTEHEDGQCTTRVLRSRYYAITVAQLMVLMREVGFEDVARDDSAFFQPVLVGFRPRAPAPA
ncbi:MAG: class I SAM-dependent methyltransferase [bacterium]